MTSTPETDTYVLFELAGTIYGVLSRDVQRMEMVEKLTPVPNAPPFVEGIVLSRGKVIPAVNLRLRFGFERSSFDLRTRLLIVSHVERAVGLLVDSAREFISIPASTIQTPPEGMTDTTGRYLRGIATMDNRVILILDIPGLLDSSVM